MTIVLPRLCSNETVARQLVAAQKGRMRGTTVEIRAKGAAVLSDSFLREFFTQLKGRGAAGYFVRGLGTAHIRHARTILREFGMEEYTRFAVRDPWES
jgi:hypothetical protein